MAEDLAKLQGMVNKAKQSTGMQTLAALWTDMLRGKIAGMVLRWNQQACGPRDLDMPEEESEEEEGGYTADVLVPAAPVSNMRVPIEEPNVEIGEVLSPLEQPRRASLSPIGSDDTAKTLPFKEGPNPMMDYLKEVRSNPNPTASDSLFISAQR